MGPGPWPLALAAVLVTVWFTFLPSFGFILAGAPLVEASRGDLRFGAPLSAITAVVVALALFAQLRLRCSVLQVIGAAAAVGALLAGVAKLSG